MGALATATQVRPTLSKVSWTSQSELSFADWLAQGHKLGHMGRSAGWWIGDWLRYGNTAYGERYVRAARVTGYDVQTLMNMVYVASRFPISRRRENLSWSHHEALAALDPDEQDNWLDQAADHKWAVSDLRTMRRSSRNGHSCSAQRSLGSEAAVRNEEAGSVTPSIVVICPRCGRQFDPGTEAVGVPDGED